jgi:pimeloyl-ACP methyl ester carboxylesterase
VPSSSSPDLASPRELADPDSRFETSRGIDVHHKVAGDPTDPAVVLHHHFYGNVFTWRHVLPGLQDDHHVAAFDRPGFGLTERPPRIAGVTAPLHTTHQRPHHPRPPRPPRARGRGPRRFERGGTTALETYALRPNASAPWSCQPRDHRRRRTARCPAAAAAQPAGARLGPHLVERFAGEVTLERIARSWHDPTRATDDDLDAYTRPLQVDGWQRRVRGPVRGRATTEPDRLLPTVDVPTLVVTGASDRVISRRGTAAPRPRSREPATRCSPTAATPRRRSVPTQFLEVLRSFLDDLPPDAELTRPDASGRRVSAGARRLVGIGPGGGPANPRSSSAATSARTASSARDPVSASGSGT